MDAFVSVIIPAYNCSSFLWQTVESILNQTYKRLEIIIVDDFSTDKSYLLAQQLAVADRRIRVFQNPKNLGVAATRNRGLDEAMGEYIAFCDADDLWMMDKLEKQLALLQQVGRPLCCTSYGFISETGEPIGKPYMVKKQISYSDLLRQNWIGLSSVLLQKDFLGERRFRSDYFHEDYVLWLELLRDGEKACGAADVLMLHRRGGRSSDKWNAAKQRWEIYRRMEEFSVIRSLYYCGHYLWNGIRKFCP